MRYIFIVLVFIWIALGLSGCDKEDIYAHLPFVPDNYNKLYFDGHINMCKRVPDSMFCVNGPSVGDIKPTREYVMNMIQEHRYVYTSDGIVDYWTYRDNIYETTYGDCEDIAMTKVNHLVEDGIDKKYIYLGFRLLSSGEGHVFVIIETSDAGFLHVDYYNSGQALEPNINGYMSMVNVGTNRWVKGNIN